MLKQSYWKVVLRYGHVGGRNEIYVARYLAFNEEANLIDVYESAKNMPGVKGSKGVNLVKKVDYTDYCAGKKMEESNFYLQQLMSFSKTANNAA